MHLAFISNKTPSMNVTNNLVYIIKNQSLSIKGRNVKQKKGIFFSMLVFKSFSQKMTH